MGCGPSAPKAPGDAPPEWKDTITATFTKLGGGSIKLVPKGKAETMAGEISILGEAVLSKQLAIGDFASKEVTLDAFIELLTEKIEGKGWGEVAEFLTAIDIAFDALTAEGESAWEPIARKVFKGFDEDWCDPAKTGKVDVATEAKEVGDNTEVKAAGLIAGLSGEIDADAFVAHCKEKVGSLGLAKFMTQLTVLAQRLEKVADIADAMG